jgi:phosphomannomutase
MSEVVKQLLADVGPHVYHRRDIQLAERIELVSRLRKNPPERFAGHRIRAIETLDGLKLRFDKGWLLFRASGTEPILRLYCEMETKKDVQVMLEEAERLARGDLTLW